ncbi:MAG TPA: hypothetical protein VIX81_06565 [Gammaproteobacteria bacterium]
MSGWRDLLFPPEPRGFPGRRWVNIGLRSVHLLGLAGMGGGWLYAAPLAAWQPYLWLTLASGTAMLLLEVSGTCLWLLQLRGLAVLAKLLLLALAGSRPEWLPGLLVAVIVLSAVFAHAPAGVRYFSPFHGRRIDRL